MKSLVSHKSENIRRGLFGDSAVAGMIVLNTIALFLDAFPWVEAHSHRVFFWVDYLCTIYFLSEVISKVALSGWKVYWTRGWNRFDFTVVALSTPSLLSPFIGAHIFSVVLVLRMARLVRFIRFMKFIPNGYKIWIGILGSLRASVGIFIALFILNLMFAMGATMLFGHLLPEHFGDPLTSSYTLFKVFTIEGWYQIPDLLVERGDTSVWAIALRLYFIVAVITGGVLGLSLANAIFVNQMMADNNAPLERRVNLLRKELHKEKDEILRALHKEMLPYRNGHPLNGHFSKASAHGKH